MKEQLHFHSDVQAEEHIDLHGVDWVGMTQIQSALTVGTMSLPVQLDLGVNLISGFRGIHMSRLYKVMLDYFLQRKLNSENIFTFLKYGLATQENLSTEIGAKIQLQFPIVTTSLKSSLNGFRNYPMQLIATMTKGKDAEFWLRIEVLYSSTCPQSASLSMEMLQAFVGNPERLPATPHAQRSRAEITVCMKKFDEKFLEFLITEVEDALKTPVQTVVKKADEMEFAKRNAENLMFCEDAARKIAHRLSKIQEISGFSVYCEHQESLHPHNASSFMKSNWTSPQNIHFD